MSETIDFGDFSTYASTAKAAEEGKPSPDRTFQWFGQTIRMRPHVAPMRFAAYYHALRTRSLTVSELHGVLEGAIHPEDFHRFAELGDENDVDGAGLIAVIDKILEAFAADPTQQPSTSSDGSATTSPPSTLDSAAKESAPPSIGEKVASDLRIPFPPESRADARAALRLVDEPIVAA